MSAPAGGESIKEYPVKILLLGPPEIYINGKLITIKRRLNRALIFYLAAQRQPVSREELSALFWQEESDDIARKNLRESLSRVRTGLGVHDLLITNGEQVSLNKDMVKVDAIELDKIISPLLSSSEMNNNASLPDWMVLQLKSAMALCRTNRFLQGFYLPNVQGFENWVELTNQSYHYTRTKVYDRLVDHFISTGNLEEAILWLGKALELNPMDESNNYLTLICLRDTGRNQELIDYAGYLENLYGQQQEPFPEKFNELRKQAIEGKAKPVTPGSAWPNVEQGEPPFIGREEELENLSRVMRRRGLLLLEGEAGIGKTRLMKQFFGQQPFSPRLFYASGHPLASQVAFYAIISAVRDQLLDLEWQALDPADQERLSFFYHTTLQAPGGPDFPRVQNEFLPVMEDVFLAFARLLAIAAARRPLLFILDDALFLDQASISLVTHLIENGFFEKYGLLVVIVSHEAENIPLNLMLQRVQRERRLEKIHLPDFTDREMTRFIEMAVGRKPETEAIEIMRRLSGGNPYFLTECVRAAKWTIHADKTNLRLEDCSIPDSVFALVRDKVNGLEPDTAQMIKAAAILGKKFCPDVLEEMTGLESGKITAGSEELIREGFIKVNSEIRPMGGFEFRHDVEREVLLRNMDPSQKKEMHFKAAAALEKRRKGIPRFAESLAGHYEYSLQQREALNAWLEAGRYARTQYLVEETHQAYGSALQLIRRIPGHFEEAKIMQVINEWGNFAHDRDDTETGKYIYQTCLEIGNATNSLLLIGAAHSGLGRVADFEYDYETAVNSFQRALFYLTGEEQPSERIKALSRLGIMKFGMDEYIQAYDLLNEAFRLLPKGKDPETLENRVNILTYLSFLDIFMGNPLEAGDNAAELARLSILVNRKSARVQAHGLLAMSQYFNSQVQMALLTCKEYQPMAENLQVRFWWSLLDNVSALAHLYTGNLDQGWISADRAQLREKNYPMEKLYMQAVKVKGDIYRSLEDYPRAKEFYLELQQSGVKSYQTIGSQQGLAAILVKEGGAEKALHVLEDTIREARKRGLAGIELNARMASLFQVRNTISVELFEQEGGEIQAEMTSRGMLDAKTFEFMIPALASEMRGENERAIRHYQEMIEYLISEGNIWMEFNVLKRLIELSRITGKNTRPAVLRINELLAHLASNANHPAIKGSFMKFRNKWKRYVNDMSM